MPSSGTSRARVKCSTGTSFLNSRDSRPLSLGDFVPPLNCSNYKGNHGKVGIVGWSMGDSAIGLASCITVVICGGCNIYTGAPYFAAKSSLLVGADLAYVFCTPSASPVIKSYSPELMVLPYLPETNEASLETRTYEDEAERCVNRIKPWLQRLTSLVIGPGLGDDPLVQATALDLISEARSLDLPLVIDGSAFNLFTPSNIHIINGNKKLVLTPNISELGRLAKAAGIQLEGPMGPAWQKDAVRLGKALGGPIILSKGPDDVLSNNGDKIPKDWAHRCDSAMNPAPNPKRCGGQGDILAGALGTFLSWTTRSTVLSKLDGILLEAASICITEEERLVAACLMASSATRLSGSLAFEKKGRSMTASDMLAELPRAAEILFDGDFYNREL